MPKLNNILRLVLESKEPIIRNEEMVLQGFSRQEVSRALAALTRAGEIYKISSGLFSKEKIESLDIFYLAQKIFSGYLGLTSACYIYGWLEYFPFEIFVITANKSAKKKVGKFFLRTVDFGKRATGSTLFQNYFISTKGKTLFDIFYKPEFVGGWKEVMKIVYKSDAGENDWEEFLRFAFKFGSKSFLQRTGYLLYRLKEETGKKIPIDLKKLKPKKPSVVKIGSGKIFKFSKDWKIFDCEGEKIFEWFHGS